MMSFSNRDLVIYSLAVFSLGFSISLYIIMYSPFSGVVVITDEVTLDNITFAPLTREKSEDRSPDWGIVIGDSLKYRNYSANYMVRRIRILSGLSRHSFIEVCNHEVLHQLLDIPDHAKEEEYVGAMDSCVRFQVCDRLYEILQNESSS